MPDYTLNATVTDATTLTLDGVLVTLPKTVTPSADHTYVLKATGPGGTVTSSVFVDVGNPPPPPPPPPPLPTGTLPAWLDGVALGAWKEIPNSVLWSNSSDTYFANPLGPDLPVPSQRPAPDTGVVTWGTNKYGFMWVRNEGRSNHMAGGQLHYGGIGFDSRGSRILVGGGDVSWPENSYRRFTFGVDTPYWEQNVIRSCHHQYFKHPDPATGERPVTLPEDDDRLDRMYDGSHLGGHSYFYPKFIEAREWVVHFGCNQFYPYDGGGSASVHVGDVKSGLWITDNPIADLPDYNVYELTWQEKHPVTEDVYYWAGIGRVWVWRQATNIWEILLETLSEGGSRLTGSIDYEHDYILFCDGYGFPEGDQRNHWMTSLTSPVRVYVQIVGPYAAEFKTYRQGGMRWCPDRQQHLWYSDADGFVYTITKTGATEFTVDRLTTTGVERGIYQHDGGILNNFQYVAALRGMVLRLSDNHPIFFIRTG